MNLQGRVALVTGAAPSIGRAVCLALARAGASVIAIDLDREALDETAAEVEAAGGRVETVAGDASREATFEYAVEHALRTFGRIDILVNHAAVEAPCADFGGCPVAEFDRMMAVNVRGTFLGLKHVLPRLVEQRSGAIVNFSSAADGDEDAAGGPYAASRQAVLGLTGRPRWRRRPRVCA